MVDIAEFPSIISVNIVQAADLAVTADRDGVCRRTRLSTGIEFATFAVPGEVSGGVAADSAGNLVAIGCADGVVRLWRNGDTQILELPVHRRPIRSVAVSADGGLVAAGAEDGAMVIYDVRARSHVAFDANEALVVGYSKSVRAITIDPTGKYVVTASQSGTTRVWDISSGSLLDSSRSVGAISLAVALSRSGRLLAVGTAKGEIQIIDRATGDVRIIAGHVDAVLALDFGAEDHMLVTGGRDCVVKVWNTSTGSEPTAMHDLNGWVRSVAFSPDGSTVTAVDGGGVNAVWKRDGELIAVHGDATVHVGSIERSSSWRRAADLYQWNRLKCGCGRGAAHVPADFARLASAVTVEEARGSGLIDDVEVQNMLFESMVPVTAMALLALAEEPLSRPARRTMIELVLAGVSGETHFVEYEMGKRGIEDRCADLVRPHIELLRSLLTPESTPNEAEMLKEILASL